MTHLIIKNLGPIKYIEIDLNKVNILIGPQCSGKSIIAKVVSFCQWAEKRRMLEGAFDYNLKKNFKQYYRLGNEFFSKNTQIIYSNDIIDINIYEDNIKFHIKKEDDYEINKNIYIPSERNFAAAIPNLGKYNENYDSIMGFLYEWFEAKKKYISPLIILNLEAAYYYSKNDNSDKIRIKSNGKNIETFLSHASSGLQSIVPLYILVDHLTNNLNEKKKIISIDELSNEQQKQIRKIKNDLKYFLDNSGITDIQREEALKMKDFFDRLPDNLARITKYKYTNFTIEEPEQNLFPETQKELIYYIIKSINSQEYNHQVLMTTHSPYILYALNNCIMGWLVKDNIPGEIASSLDSYKSWIDPKTVSVWQIKDGELFSIQDKQTKSIEKHYFNGIMNKMMDEYYTMLNFLIY